MAEKNSDRRLRDVALELIRTMFGPPVLPNAIRVSLFVGTCLNAINQGPALWRGEPPSWGKLALNFLVPFLVSSYSGAKARLAKAPE